MTIYGFEPLPGHVPMVTGPYDPYPQHAQLSHEFYDIECSCGMWSTKRERLTASGHFGTRRVRAFAEHCDAAITEPNVEIEIGFSQRQRVKTVVKVITTSHYDAAEYLANSNRSQYYASRSWLWVKDAHSSNKARKTIGGFCPNRDEAISKARQFLQNEKVNGASIAIHDLDGIQVVTSDLPQGLAELLTDADRLQADDFEGITLWRARASVVLNALSLIQRKDEEMAERFKQALKSSLLK